MGKFEDIVHASITIQRAYRRYKKKKEERKKSAKIMQQKKLALKSEMPKKDIIRKPTKFDGQKKTKKRNLAEEAFAAVTIQRAYRRYKIKKDGNRKSANKSKYQPQGSSDKTAKKPQGLGRKQRSRPKLAEVVQATTTIQRAYRRFRKEEKMMVVKKCEQPQTRLKSQKLRQEHPKKPSLTSQARVKRQKSTPKFSDIVQSAVIIQRAYRSFKKRKHGNQQRKSGNKTKQKEQDFKKKQTRSSRGATQKQSFKRQQTFSDVVLATRTIQKAYRSYSARKRARLQAKGDLEELPDLAAADVVAATIKIQSAYKGFQTRKMVKKHKEVMPDLNCAQVKDATIKIQSAYRGFQTRKIIKEQNQDLPDLKAAEVVAATIKIQSAYKGFRTRKMIEAHREIMPDLNCAQVQDATVKIQSAFKGYQVRKTHAKVPFTPQPSIDFDHMPLSDMTEKHSKRVPPVPQRFDTQDIQRKTKSTSSNVPNDFGVKETLKSPLPARSSRLKEVAIPTVPPSSHERPLGQSKQEQPSSTSSEIENKDDQPGFLQQSLLRKESLQSFFKKQSEPSSPITPTQPAEEKERGRKESLTRAFREAGETIRSRSKSKEKHKKELSLPQKEMDEQTKSKIGGFFSSMFKSKSKQKPTTPTDPLSPDMKAMANVEFKFDETMEIKSHIEEKPQKLSMTADARDELIKSASPKTNTSDAESRRSDKLSRTSSKEDEIASCSSGSQFKLNKSAIGSKVEGRSSRRMSQESKEISSKPGANISKQVAAQDSKTTSVQSELEDPNLKKDLIHVVLSAVEENWLNQAPKPTLDKVAALQALDSDPELENSERSTSEADYVKKKMKAQKSEDLNSDDEGAQLCKQESADGDLPYVETTLPQEKPGIVTITPSSQRVSQCKLTSTERPRSSSPRKPGKLSQYVKTKEKADPEHNKEPMTVKLPRQESKTKMKAKPGSSQQSWDKFSAAGLQSPKQVRKTAPQPKPEKKKQPKKYESTEPIKSPTDTGRAGLQTPTGTQIVSPEECSCDCHHESPPNTLTRTLSQKSRGVLRSSMVAASTSSSGSSSRPVPCAASRK